MNPSCKFFETIHGHKTVSFWYLTFWIYTFIRRAFCVFSTNFSQRSRNSRRWNLTTSSSPTNVISVAAFLASSMGTFFCFWTPLNFDFFFGHFFFSTDCLRPIFPPFGIALCERFAWSQYEERNNTVLCSQALQVWKH